MVVVAATLMLGAATVTAQIAAAPAARAAAGGDPSAEAVALAEAARTGQRVEVVEEDTETETVWANPDGTVTSEISQSPVRVANDAGDLVPVDLDLHASEGRLAPRAAAEDVSFSASGSGELASVDLAGPGSFGLGFGDSLGAPSLQDGSAAYPVAGSDPSSVVVSATSGGFAAHVLLPEAPASTPTYTFPLQLDGLDAELRGNQLYLSDAAGDLVAMSAPLSMWDSHVDAAGDPDRVVPVEAALVPTAGGGTVLRLRPSMAYLSDPDTVYPVVVDPDVSSVDRQADTYVLNSDPDANFSSSYASRTGSTNATNKYRSYEKFFIDKYLGKNIETAELNMYQYFAGTCSSRVTNILATPDEPQSSGITWNNKPSVTTDARWSAQLSGNVGGAAGGCGGGAMQDIDVTKMLNGYTSGALPTNFDNSDGDDNTGDHAATIALQAANEGAADSDKRFCSFNAASAPAGHNCNPGGGVNRAASLSLTYLPDMGEKGFYSMSEHPLSDRSTLKVNNENGNALLAAQDVNIKGRGMDLKVTRYYNGLAEDAAQPTADLSMGPKWSLSVGSDVRLWKRSQFRYDYVAGSGAVYAGFVRKSQDTAAASYKDFRTPSGGVGSDLRDNGDGTFTLTNHKSQKEMVFKKVDANSDDLYLWRERDRSDNLIQYDYATGGHQLATITDTTGRAVSVSFTSGRITSISESNGPNGPRTWAYQYTGGRLTKYTDPAGNQTDYGWSGGTNPQVETITDSANESGLRPQAIIAYQAAQAVGVHYAADAGSGTVGYTVNYFSKGAVTIPCTVGSDDSASVWHSSNTATGDTTYCFKDRDSGATAEPMTRTVIDAKNNSRSTTFSVDSQPSTFTGGGSSSGAKSGSTVASYGGGELADRLSSLTDPKDTGATSATKTVTVYGYEGSTYTFPGHKYAPSATTATGSAPPTSTTPRGGSATPTWTPTPTAPRTRTAGTTTRSSTPTAPWRGPLTRTAAPPPRSAPSTPTGPAARVVSWPAPRGRSRPCANPAVTAATAAPCAPPTPTTACPGSRR